MELKTIFRSLFKHLRASSHSQSVIAPESWNPSQPLPAEFSATAKALYSQLGLTLPSSEAGLRYLFGPENSYFQSGRAVVLVEPHVARVAAFYNPLTRVNRKKTAFFGFWETQNTLASNQTLFEQVERWARREGAQQLYGPIQFSTFGRYRLQLSHFGEGETFDQEPVNPDYYVTLMNSLGFTLDQVYSTYRSTDVGAIRAVIEKISGKAFFLESAPFQIRPIDEAFIGERTHDLLHAVNDIFSDNFAFTPIDENTFKAAFNSRFVSQICPNTSFVVEHTSGKIAAICICYFDSAHPRTLFVKTVGIVKEFRGQGISLVQLIREILVRAPECGRVVLCLMKKGNFPSLLMQDFIQEEKTYGLFRKDLDL